jgi:hypothetical protein
MSKSGMEKSNAGKKKDKTFFQGCVELTASFDRKQLANAFIGALCRRHAWMTV